MIKFFISFLFLIPMSFSYIDPGTGGYLISSIWSSIVGFFALLIGVIIRFFRHTLKTSIFNFYLKYRILSSIIYIFLLFLISYLIYLLFFNYSSVGGLISPISDDEGVQLEHYNDFYFLYHGGLYNQDGVEVKSWNFSYLSLIDSEGFYYAQEYYESSYWGKFHFNGSPIWLKQVPIHHEIYESLDKNYIYTMTKEVQSYNGREVEFDVILKFDKDGNLIESFSLWDNLEEFQKWHNKLELDNPINTILPENHKKENRSIWGGYYDYYHLNSFSEVPKNSKEGLHPAFNEGNWILSFRHGSMVFIIDKDSKEVLWRGIYNQIDGNIEGQHAAQMDINGNILLFDNGRYREKSRILEINPIDLSSRVLYEDDSFFTGSQGYVQFLDNGDMFITQSELGRIFEVNNEGNIIWEYLKPVNGNRTQVDPIELEVYRAYKYNTSFIENLLNN